MKRIFKLLIMPVFLCCIILLGGCKQETPGTAYAVYYTNDTGTKLVEQEYKTTTDDQLELINELIVQMNAIQNQNDIEVIKPDHLTIDDINLDDETVSIYFSEEYKDMNNSTELLYRSAIVKMLTQLDSVHYVQFYVDGSPAQYSDGTEIGLMTAEDFADDSSDSMGIVQWKDIYLYYSNKLGDKLVKTKVSVAYSKNVSLEKMVVMKLIKGPTDSSVFETLPSDLKLLNISVNNGVCYVNLDSSFLTEMVNVSTEIPIYSIVNSLCSLDSVDSVKILINGDSSKTFRESISLENTFTFNDSIVSN